VVVLLTAPALSCRDLALGYGSSPALSGVTLMAGAGETLALLGSSGSGKTTLLNAIAGFLRPLAGEIWLAGREVSGPAGCVPPERRRIGMVFQDYALWPHLPVLATVAYPLRRRGLSRSAADERARALLARFGLAGLAARRAGELSGGEQQRVGLARALACDPAVFLFDEPTAHLDAPLREQILAEVARHRAEHGAAAVYATHDAAEALAVADRVVVLHSGGVAQAGPPAELYAEPDDLTVAALTGPVSVLSASSAVSSAATLTIEVGGVRATVPGTRAPGAAGSGAGRPVVLVRPDWATLGGDLPGEVTAIRFRGPHTDYDVLTPAGVLLIREAGPPRRALGPAGWALHRARLLPPS
jgi:ABC-type Fe3+/spermidine/putrescine transport system ATPase subunit